MIDCKLVNRAASYLFALLFLVVVLGCGSNRAPGNLHISTQATSFAAGTTVQLLALDTNSMQVTMDVTSASSWASSNTAVATVSSTGLVTGVASGSATITATYQKDQGSMALSIGAPAIRQLVISPANATVYTGATKAYTATATYANNTTGPLTSGVSWGVSPSSVATISASGMLTAIAPGTYAVTAAGGGQTQAVTGTVSSVPLTSIAIGPANASVAGGGTLQLAATGTYADGSTQDISSSVAWTSGNTALLTISATGLASAQSTTTTTTVTVTAQAGTITATDSVQVTPSATVAALYVIPTSSSIANNTAEKHMALAYYSDGTQVDVTSQVTWSVTESGATEAANLVKGKRGHAGASATDQAQASGRQTPNVNTNTTSVLSVNPSGVDTAAAPGVALVQATLGTTQSQGVVIVTPATITALNLRASRALFPVGSMQQVQAIGTFSDGTQQDLSLSASWQTSNPAVATIDNTGLATGVSGGDIQFSATFGGLTASTTGFQVLSHDLVSTALLVPFSGLAAGISEQFSVIGTYSDGSTHDLTGLATWVSSAPSVMTVDQDGKAVGISQGIAQVTATVNGQEAIARLSVQAGSSVASLLIFGPSYTIPLGVTQDFTAVAILSNGFIFNVSSQVIWVSSNPSVVTVDGNGRVKAGSVGSATVSATTLGATQTSSVITVDNAAIKKLLITPSSGRIAAATPLQYAAMGTFDDGTVLNITPDVSWNTSDNTVASIDAAGLAEGMKPGTVQVSASFQGQLVTSPLTVTNATLQSVAITPPNTELPVSIFRRYRFIGSFSDGSTQDLTPDALWSTTTPTLLYLVAAGLDIGEGTGVKPGVASVTAQRGYFAASTPIQITDATLTSLAATPATSVLREGKQQQLAVLGTFSDGYTQDLTAQVFKTPANPSIITVNDVGLVTGLAVGSTQLNVALAPATTAASFQVLSNVLTSIAITPASPTVTVGGTQQFVAIGTYQDGSTENISQYVAWSSSNPAGLGIDENGLATAYTAGAGTITVTAQGNGATGTVSVTVQSASSAPALTAVNVAPASASVAAGTTTQLTATGTYADGSSHDISGSVTWSSSSPAVATVSSTGVASGLAVGSATITAQSGTLQGTTALTVTHATLVSLAVTPANPTVTLGGTQQFTLTGTFSDGTTQNLSSAASWGTSASSVATISTSGLATGTGTGSVQFTASYGGETATTGNVQVTAATLVSVALTPSTAQIADGSTQQFTLTGTYSDGSTRDLSSQATWTSSAPSVATISSTGLATGASTGPVQFTATYNGQTATTGTVQISTATLSSIAITPTTAQIAKGTTQQFTATGAYTDGTTQNLSSSVTWSSSNTSVLSIGATGLATGTGIGTAQLTASLNGHSGTVTGIQVTAPTLVSIAFSPAHPSVAAGTSTQVTVTGTYSDGSTQTLSSGVSFTSSNPSAVSVSASGVISGVATGSSTVSVQAGGISSSFGVTVTQATLTSIAITPTNPPAFSKGSTEQFTAIGTFSDGTTQNLSSSVTWTSSNPAVFTINGSGLATGTGVGSGQLTASYQGQTATTPSFQVTPASLSSLTVKPTSARIAAGTSTQFTATGVYSDGTTQDLSSSVTWTSFNQGTATVTYTGAATGVAAGQTTIQAQSGSLQSQATLIVSTATLSSVALMPNTASLPAGAPQQFSLIGTFSDGSQQNLSGFATWSSATPAVATISSTGAATAVTTGSTQFTATYNGQSATTGAVNVTPATLVSVAITPSSPSFAAGTGQQLRVIGTYSDGTTVDLTSQATFTSTNNNVVAVSPAGVANGVAPGSAQVSVSVDGQTATTSSVSVTPSTLTSIAINPSAPSFANGTTQHFTAIGTFSDGTTEDLSSQVVWASANPQVATINGAGVADADGVGSTQISATLDGVTMSTGTVQVTPATIASLSISPMTAQIAKGTTQQFTAIGNFTDGTTQNLTNSVMWASTDGAIASINAAGLATGAGAGSAQISATYNGTTATTNSFQVTPATLVSVSFNPASPSVAAGTSTQVFVTGTFSDGSTQDLTSTATYTSSNPSDVTVSSNGVVMGVAPGSSTITVQADGNTSTFNVTVTSATLSSITITPANPAPIAKGTSQQFTATGNFSDGSTQNLSSSVTWASMSTSVLLVNANGLATGAGVGSTTLTASYQGLSTNSGTVQVTPAAITSISVTPTSASIQAGATQQFLCYATYTDGNILSVTNSVTWTSSNTSAATIANGGLATGQNAGGTTTIQAQTGSNTSTATLSVTAATPPPVTLQSITVAPSTASIAQGGTQQFTATGNYSDGSTQNLSSQVTWHSSQSSVATITNQGLASGTGGGTAQISASYSGVSATAGLTVSPATLTSIAVTPANASIAAGTGQQYQAIGTFSDGSTQSLTTAVSWTSSNTSAATMNQAGLATSSAPGTTTITAQSGSVTATANLTVTNATPVSLQVTPSSVSLPAGDVQQLMVTATFTDSSSQNVTTSATYSTSNAAVATVNSVGLLNATGTGTASITITLSPASVTLPVTITNAVLTSISVTPANVSIAAGTSQQLTATGTFSDGSTQDLTNATVWASSSSATATVSATGEVTVNQVGSATITATSGSVTGSASVTGTPAVISSIAVSPASTTLAAGQTQQFIAIATMSDGTQQTVTSSAHWSTSDPTRGTVSNTSGSNGFFTSIAAGTVNVIATDNSISGSAPVTIQQAALSAIHVTPNPESLPAGTTQALTATGTYTDGSTANVNASVTWTSSSASIASVDTAGNLHAVSPGAATVTATANGISGTDNVSVTNAVLASIAITPGGPTVSLGLQQQLTATGTYTDGSTANISTQVQWSSSSPSIATVSSTGLISTLATGSTNVTATLNGVSQHVPVTVGAAVLESIAVQSAQTSFPLGLNLQLQAIGTYSDGTTQNLTSSVTWSSQSTNIGVVSATGVASGVNLGTFNATATKSGITGSEAVTVTTAVLQSITLTPANSTVVNVLGSAVQFTATGHYSDGSTQNLTNSVHWAISSGISVGTISQTGSFSTTGVGLCTVTATSGAISGSTNITVVSVI